MQLVPLQHLDVHVLQIETARQHLGDIAVARQDARLIEQARFLASQARDEAAHYQHSQIGHNYRLSNVLAAIGRGQLRVLADRVAARIDAALDGHLGAEIVPLRSVAV